MEALDHGDDDAVIVVQLSGELDASDPTWADEIEKAFATGSTRFVIDLLNVAFIDSSVVRALVLAYRRVGTDGWVRLVYTHHLISRVIQICGLADTFPQFTTVEAARRDRIGFQRSEASGDEMSRAETERRLSLSSETAGGTSHDER
jgi:anti-anti-sigma factor